MSKDNERITYEEFMTMFKFAPRMAYILYDKAEDEIEKITKEKDHYKHLYSEVKKQKDDVVNLLEIKIARFHNEEDYYLTTEDFEDLLRMLGVEE